MTKLYIGLDLHKRSSTWVGIDDKRNEVFCKKCVPTIQEVERLIARIPAPPEKTAVALEPVCGYRWITHLLKLKGIEVYPANPKKLERISKSDKKTDLNDARKLADLLRTDYIPDTYFASDKIHQLRMLVRHRQSLVSHITSFKCRIHSICNTEGEHNTSSNPMNKEGYESIINSEGNYEIKDLFSAIEELNPHVKKTEKQIKKVIENDSEFKREAALLMTMPGIGTVTAASILAEVGDFNRFPTHKHLVSYAGLNPIVRASGEKQIIMRISKSGPRVLRAAIVDAAIRVRNKEGSYNLYAYYKKMINVHKKSRLEARVALAHKMLTCLFYMVKNDVAYNDQALQSAQSEVIPNNLPGV